MAKTVSNLGRFFVVAAIVVCILLVAAFGYRSFARGRAEVNKFIFTADTSNVVRNTDFLRMNEKLGFMLSPFIYSLQDIADLYAKIAKDAGWQLKSSDGLNISEKKNTMEFVREGQRLVIDLDRIEPQKIHITITYDR